MDTQLRNRLSVLTLLAALLGPLAAGEAAKDTPVKPAKPLPPLLVEYFETTPAGQIPKGYTKTGAVMVDDQVAHTGSRSLRMDAATNGPRRITIAGDVVTALGGEHWGRLWFKVRLPVAVPKGEGTFPVIHSTLVAGSAQSPQFADAIEVRMLDTVLGPNGTFQYIYNVQPKQRPEYASGSGYAYRFSDQWTLAEWHVDHATQTYQLYIEGVEIPGAALAKGAGVFDQAEIPAVFASLSFGWSNYQPADPGFVAWIDDIALGKERLGTRGLPPEAKGKDKKRAKAE